VYECQCYKIALRLTFPELEEVEGIHVYLFIEAVVKMFILAKICLFFIPF
jgi:hypothetical protein